MSGEALPESPAGRDLGCAGEGLGVVDPYRGFGVGLGECWAGA